MKRGDVVLIREPGTPASKARPCVIVQRGSTLEPASKITVCPLTSTILAPASVRPLVQPTASNGLEQPSQVQIDWIYTHPVSFVGRRVGELDADAMTQVDSGLRRWLDL